MSRVYREICVSDSFLLCVVVAVVYREFSYKQAENIVLSETWHK